MSCFYVFSVPLQAASSNNVKKFNSLLGEDPEAIKTVDTKGWSALHKAAFKGSNDVLTILFHHDIGMCIELVPEAARV